MLPAGRRFRASRHSGRLPFDCNAGTPQSVQALCRSERWVLDDAVRGSLSSIAPIQTPPDWMEVYKRRAIYETFCCTCPVISFQGAIFSRKTGAQANIKFFHHFEGTSIRSQRLYPTVCPSLILRYSSNTLLNQETTLFSASEDNSSLNFVLQTFQYPSFSVRGWNLTSGVIVTTFDDATAPVLCLDINETFLIAGSEDHNVRVTEMLFCPSYHSFRFVFTMLPKND